jgi:type 1 glutamine amidotransferase
MKSFIRLFGAVLAGCLAAGLVQAQTPKKLLVVTVTKGFRHSSIETAEKVLANLAAKSGAFTVDYVKTDEEMAVKMTAAALKGYDGIVFANTTGILPVPDKAALLAEIKGGKAFIGMHAASDTFHGKDAVDPFIEMLGGEFQGHGEQVGVECLVKDRNHPSTKHLGESYCIQQEEIYLLKNYDKKKVRDLLVLDKHPNKKKELGHFPVTWCKAYGQGKVFYTTLGHREDVWENELFKKHILGGIKWSLGLEPGESTPHAD